MCRAPDCKVSKSSPINFTKLRHMLLRQAKRASENKKLPSSGTN